MSKHTHTLIQECNIYDRYAPISRVMLPYILPKIQHMIITYIQPCIYGDSYISVHICIVCILHIHANTINNDIWRIVCAEICHLHTYTYIFVWTRHISTYEIAQNSSTFHIYMYILHKYIRIPYLYLYNICVVTCYSCISSLCVAFGVHAPTGSQMIVWADVHDNNVAINKMHRGLEQFVCLADSCWRTQKHKACFSPFQALSVHRVLRSEVLSSHTQPSGCTGEKKKWKRASVRLDIPEITVTRSLLNM